MNSINTYHDTKYRGLKDQLIINRIKKFINRANNSSLVLSLNNNCFYNIKRSGEKKN